MLAVPLVLLASFWAASTPVAASCPKTTAIETLDLKSLEGKWYQLSSFGTLFIHGLSRCQETTITAGSDGKSFVMANDRIARLINSHVKYNWDVSANGDKLSGDLTLKFKLPIIGSVVAMPMKVLGTDNYKNFIILHVCREFASVFKFNAAFILTKKRHYQAKELESIYGSIDEILQKNNLNRSQFSLSIQTDCEDKSSSPSNTQTTSSAEKTSTDVSGTAETKATTTGTAEEKKPSESASATEHTEVKTTTEHSEKTTSVDEKTASSTEKASAS